MSPCHAVHLVLLIQWCLGSRLMVVSVLIVVTLFSQILAEVKLENTGVKPVMHVVMHQRQQQLKCSVSIN